MLPLPLAPRSRVLVSSTSSDAHTWNLVFLHLLMLEHGHEVHNLGPTLVTGAVLAGGARGWIGLATLLSASGLVSSGCLRWSRRAAGELAT